MAIGVEEEAVDAAAVVVAAVVVAAVVVAVAVVEAAVVAAAVVAAAAAQDEQPEYMAAAADMKDRRICWRQRRRQWCLGIFNISFSLIYLYLAIIWYQVQELALTVLAKSETVEDS